MIRFYLLMALTLLPGLASASFNTDWKGKASDSVIDKYGIPQNRMEYQGGEIWEYKKDCSSSEMVVPGPAGVMSMDIPSCTYLTFKVKDGQVLSAKKSYR